MNYGIIETLSDFEIVKMYDEYIEGNYISCGCGCSWQGLTTTNVDLRVGSDCYVGDSAGCLSACQARCTAHYCYCSGVRQPTCR